MAELQGVTSHFCMQRLHDLNHATVVQAVGRGVRNAQVYQWSEPAPKGTLTSYRQLRDRLDQHVWLALDVHRISERFERQPFDLNQFSTWFQKLRNRVLERRQYRLTAETDPAEYSHFLRQRHKTLLRLGMLEPHGHQTRITAVGEETAHWFELFAYSVDLAPSDPVAPVPQPIL